MKSLTNRIENLEKDTAPAELEDKYLFVTRDNGATYTGNGQTYTRADLDELEARGADITVINIVREVMHKPMPDMGTVVDPKVWTPSKVRLG
jgi:hypothetical protein